MVIDSISSFHFKELKENLFPFEKDIQEKLNIITSLGTELEDQKKQLTTNLVELLKDEEKQLLSNIKLIERNIENLSKESKYDPMSIFKNTMMYTIIVSFVSSLLGGCAGYSNLYANSTGELNNILSTIIINGFKWGILTFFIGFLISVFSAGISIIERTNKKQKLFTRIKYLKNQSEIENQRIHEHFHDKEKSLKESINNKIIDIKKRIEDLRKIKEGREIQLKAEADSKIKSESEQIKLIIEKFG